MNLASLIKKIFKINNIDFSFIEEFQFTNLLSSPIRFVVIDLRLENKKPELRRALRSDINNALQIVNENTESTEFPVLVICENEKKSTQLAKKLVKKKYKNVVVLRGGTESLSEEFHKNSHTMLYR